MMNIPLKQLLHKKDIQIAFLFLYCLFISEIVFSRNYWDRKNISITYNEKEKSLLIKCLIFDYQFGPFGEHGYLEVLDFKYLTNDGQYVKLMSWEVVDQEVRKETDIRMRQKLDGAKIKFSGTIFPPDADIWYDSYQNVVCENISNLSHASVIWYIPDDLNVKDILVEGKWHVNGLYCTDVIKNEKYVINTNQRNSALTDSNQKIHLTENYSVKVYSEGDAVVVKGADLGDNITVYTTSGKQINRTMTTDNIMKIILPANQIYIVHLGQARYKVVL